MKISDAVRRNVFVAVVMLMSGCAFTSGEVKLDYRPEVAAHQHFKGENAVPFEVGTVRDERGKDPLLLMHKVNGYGMKTSGAYLAERPVAELVREALVNALKSAAYPVVQEDTDRMLQVRLITLDFDVVSGFVTVTLNTKIILECSLTDRVTDTVLWQKTLVGNGMHKSGSLFAEDYIRPAFKAALDDVLAELLNTPAFAAAVARQP